MLPAQTCRLSGVLSMSVSHLFLQNAGSSQWPSLGAPAGERLVPGKGRPSGHGLLCVVE